MDSKNREKEELFAFNQRIVGLRHYVDESAECERLFRSVKSKMMDSIEPKDVLGDPELLAFYEKISSFAEGELSVSEFRDIIISLDTEFPKYGQLMGMTHECMVKNFSQTACARAVMEAYRSGDVKAENWSKEAILYILKGFIGDVIKANNAGTAGTSYQEYYSEGVLAVLSALPKYDPEIALPSTYFRPHIIHNVTAAMTGDRLGMHAGHVSGNVIRVKRAMNVLHEQGLPFTVSAVHDTVNRDGKKKKLSFKQVEDAIRVMKNSDVAYLSQSEKEDRTNATGIYGITDSDVSRQPEKNYLRKEMSESIRKAFAELPTMTAEVVLMSYGFEFVPGQGVVETECMSLNAIADELSEAYGTRFSTHHIGVLLTRGLTALRANPVFRSYLSKEQYNVGHNSLAFSIKTIDGAEYLGAELDTQVPGAVDAITNEPEQARVKLAESTIFTFG